LSRALETDLERGEKGKGGERVLSATIGGVYWKEGKSGEWGGKERSFDPYFVRGKKEQGKRHLLLPKDLAGQKRRGISPPARQKN